MKKEEEVKIKEDVAVLKTEVGFIKEQVSNHIPSSIKEIDKRLDNIEKKLVLWSGIIVASIWFIERFLK